jgi:hypothetical protein
MLTGFVTSVDRRIANAIIARARRRWPLLQFVPSTMIRPLLRPGATIVRRELSRTVVTRIVPAGAVALLLLLLTGSA